MWAYLLQRQPTLPAPQTAQGRAVPDLSAIAALLTAQPERRWRLSALARLSGYSPFHFLRLFQRTFHKTPSAFVLQRRLDRARELLALTSLSVTEICFAVGFESLGSFSSVFRRIVGWPPTVYRARARAQRERPLDFIPACHVGRYRLVSISQDPRSGSAPPAP